MDSLTSLFGCFGFLLVLLPVILSIVALGKIGNLRSEVQRLQAELDFLRRERKRGLEGQPPGAPHLTPVLRPPIPREAEPVTRPVIVKEPVRAHAAPGEEKRAGEVLPSKPVEPAVAALPEETPAFSIPAGVVSPAPKASVDDPFAARADAPAKPAAEKPGLEAYLGTRLFVVIGAIALALSGIFLVQYAVQHNYFTPGFRVMAGVVAGLALMGVAQWRRKQETFLAQGLSAAGIVALFAAVFAGATLYHFVGPLAGFGLLAGVTAVAVGLSLQNPGGGQLLATLALVGGFVTPILVRTDVPNVRGLFGYLLVLHIGMTAVTRFRGWSILASLTMLLSSAWLILWVTLTPWHPEHGPIYGIFLLASVASLVVASLWDPPHSDDRGGSQILTWIAAGLGLVAACLLVGRSDFSDLEWGFFAVLVAGAYVLARIRPRFEAIAWICALALLGMLSFWGLSVRPIDGRAAEVLNNPAFGRFREWLILLGAGSTLVAWGCQWKSASPARWALLSVVLGGAYVLCGYGLVGIEPRPEAWAYLPLMCAGLFAGLAVPVYLLRGRMRDGEADLSIHGHAVLFFLAIAAPMAFSDGAMTAALALLLPVAAFAAWGLGMPVLFRGVVCLFVVLVCRGVVFFGHVDEAMTGSLLWNPVVWNFGSMLGAFLLALWPAERVRKRYAEQALPLMPVSMDSVSALLQGSAAVTAFLLGTLMVRWHFQQGRLAAPALSLLERGTYPTLWLLLGAALLWMGRRSGRGSLAGIGRAASWVALAYMAAVLVVFGNPFLMGDRVGGPVFFNALLYVYAIPMMLCWGIGFMIGGRGETWDRLAGAAYGMGFLLLAMLGGLEVRQGFNGELLNGDHVSFVERGTYPIMWFALAAPMLWGARRHGNIVLRHAGFCFAFLALCMSVLFCALLRNPLWTAESVGTTPIFNWLLYVFGIQAIAAACFAWYLQKAVEQERGLALPSAIASLLLVFVLVTLEVRQYFEGEFLNVAARSHTEMIAYSFAWAVLGTLLLVAGILRQSQFLRWSSLVIMFVTVIKVFLFDMTDLQDMQRVLSFAGLGLSLMALAVVYQHFVFGKPTKAELPA